MSSDHLGVVCRAGDQMETFEGVPVNESEDAFFADRGEQLACLRVLPCLLYAGHWNLVMAVVGKDEEVGVGGEKRKEI